MRCVPLWTWLQPWIRDYDRLQSLAVLLIYIQIGCSIVGSIGALYSGVMLINLAVALFALVAIESANQSLGRTYAFLLAAAILLDIVWLILFSRDIWNISSEKYGSIVIFSVRVTLAMQCTGFCVRLSSSLLWIQMYRLGASYMNNAGPPEDLANSFLSPPNLVFHAPDRQISDIEESLGGSIYDPIYYSSLFEEGQGNGCLDVDKHTSRMPSGERLDGVGYNLDTA